MAIDRSGRLRERIVKYLQERYRRTGVNAPVSWRTIWIELSLTEDEISKALQAAADQSDIVIVDRDHIKLGPNGLE
jgi:hypothetical protein